MTATDPRPALAAALAAYFDRGGDDSGSGGKEGAPTDLDTKHDNS